MGTDGAGEDEAAALLGKAAALGFACGLTFHPGSFVNGDEQSGLDAIARALTRLLPETAAINSGEVWFDGEDLLRLPPNRLRALRGTRISYISQDPMTSLAPGLTIGQQMMDVLYREPWSRREKWSRCVDALDWVSLPG